VAFSSSSMCVPTKKIPCIICFSLSRDILCSILSTSYDTFPFSPQTLSLTAENVICVTTLIVYTEPPGLSVLKPGSQASIKKDPFWHSEQSVPPMYA
jgi:hypothetical protein